MAAKPDVSGYERFSDVTGRLDEIIDAVRDKETSLERSLDLFDEAIELGSRAVDLVDQAAFSPEERERLVESENSDTSKNSDASAGTVQKHASEDSGSLASVSSSASTHIPTSENSSVAE